MIKKYEIYKTDKWNMMTVEVNGKTLIVREISDQWGEECHTFLSRPAMLHWAEQRFPRHQFEDREEEYEQMMEAFRRI